MPALKRLSRRPHRLGVLTGRNVDLAALRRPILPAVAFQGNRKLGFRTVRNPDFGTLRWPILPAVVFPNARDMAPTYPVHYGIPLDFTGDAGYGLNRTV